jgi:hypothetical protein
MQWGLRLQTGARLDLQFKVTAITPARVRKFLPTASRIFWCVVAHIIAAGIWDQIAERLAFAITVVIPGAN